MFAFGAMIAYCEKIEKLCRNIGVKGQGQISESQSNCSKREFILYFLVESVHN